MHTTVPFYMGVGDFTRTVYKKRLNGLLRCVYWFQTFKKHCFNGFEICLNVLFLPGVSSPHKILRIQ